MGWSLLDGGVATFLANSDTESVMIAHEAGYSTMQVTYESTGEHQGSDSDQATCLIINVEIETAPMWVLSDTDPVECVADAAPSPAETGGSLTWALLDENDNPVNWATFDPNGTSGDDLPPGNESRDCGKILVFSGVAERRKKLQMNAYPFDCCPHGCPCGCLTDTPSLSVLSASPRLQQDPQTLP